MGKLQYAQLQFFLNRLEQMGSFMQNKIRTPALPLFSRLTRTRNRLAQKIL